MTSGTYVTIAITSGAALGFAWRIVDRDGTELPHGRGEAVSSAEAERNARSAADGQWIVERVTRT